ncbi:MAG: hypothetical protein KAI24_04620, partial [Planctomycetes bacterium]|nr:hypothetical protein [Planctomycetota bacterium]
MITKQSAVIVGRVWLQPKPPVPELEMPNWLLPVHEPDEPDVPMLLPIPDEPDVPALPELHEPELPLAFELPTAGPDCELEPELPEHEPDVPDVPMLLPMPDEPEVPG